MERGGKYNLSSNVSQISYAASLRNYKIIEHPVPEEDKIYSGQTILEHTRGQTYDTAKIESHKAKKRSLAMAKKINNNFAFNFELNTDADPYNQRIHE